MKTHSKKYLVNVLSNQQKITLTLLLSVWASLVTYFLFWWFQPTHIVGFYKHLINTLLLFWTLLYPAYFFYFVYRMKKPNPELKIPVGLKVAMVVTKAPSEPFKILKQTLIAMLEQKYPHDTWLADEDPTEEVYKWCKEHGVKVSTRKGIPEYNRDSWPRRKKCKEGNLAYFYDKYGYDQYDLVIQLDADHIPQENYLEEMIRPFADPKVGYVSAPSICSANADKSWTARARLYAEGTMHGALQAGYSNGWAPLCFGSHYAVRTKALKEIGGLGPELAEDHSTTFMMNVYGWKGVHAIDAIAIGDGPNTFADCVTQEFQWSRSLMILLCTLTPKYIGRLPFKLKFQFVFSELWYPLYTMVMFMGYLLPFVALATQQAWVNIPYLNFLMGMVLISFVLIQIITWIKNNRLMRPTNSKVISWETTLFQLIRWPWALLGCIFGVVDSIKRKPFNFKVTPKHESDFIPLPLRSVIPYLFLSLASIIVAFVVTDAKGANGYLYFAMLQGLAYLVVVIVVIYRHIYENIK